jgi:hypothetical protein
VDMLVKVDTCACAMRTWSPLQPAKDAPATGALRCRGISYDRSYCSPGESGGREGARQGC